MVNLSLQQKMDIINLYNSNKTIKEISYLYNIKEQTLRYWIKRQKETKWRGRRVYTLDENYFNKIDSSNKAYFLGFITADGHVPEKSGHRGFKIEISKEDIEILEKLKKELKFSGPIFIRKEKYAQIKILSNIIGKDLYNYGLRHNKTKTLELTDLIPDEFFPDYIRGFFDGDGCLYVSEKHTQYYFKLIGNRTYIKKLKERLQKTLNLNFTEENHGTTDYIVYIKLHRREDIEKICRWIYYKEDITKLTRKYNKFLKYLEKRKIHNRNTNQKLNIQQVIEIKNRLKNGNETLREIAKDYGISHGPIGSIKNNHIWKNV